jgi:hypothetical protein
VHSRPGRWGPVTGEGTRGEDRGWGEGTGQGDVTGTGPGQGRATLVATDPLSIMTVGYGSWPPWEFPCCKKERQGSYRTTPLDGHYTNTLSDTPFCLSPIGRSALPWDVLSFTGRWQSKSGYVLRLPRIGQGRRKVPPAHGERVYVNYHGM